MSELTRRGAEHFAEDFRGSSDPATSETQRANLWKWIAQKRWPIALLALAILALRIVYVLHFRIDSDEPQHLHVVWGWTRGLLPYRDLFDNHAPVFQALCAPLFWLLGERADIILPMRLAMLPLFAVTIVCVLRIVVSFASPRVAVWSAGLAALYPIYFLNSVEFRPDQLWTAIWMVTLTVLVSGRPTVRRAFLAGVLLGLSFAVSMKSVLMLAALGSAVLLTFLIGLGIGGMRGRWSGLAKCAAAALAGMVIVPALVILIFIALGVGREMAYCILQHNILSGNTSPDSSSKLVLRIVCWLPVAIGGGIAIGLLKLPAPRRLRLCFSYLASAFYYIYLVSAWPVLTAEDFLPFAPAMALWSGPLLLWLYDRGLRALGASHPLTALPLLLCEVAGIFAIQLPWVDHAQHKIGLVADTLRLTTDRDLVMDSKGETIYRRRAYYYVLEKMTLARIKNGSISNDIIERLIDQRVPLATLRRIPDNAKRFIQQNYVPIAWRLRVLGQEFPPRNQRPHGPINITVRIPARYTFVTPDGPLPGKLDGVEINGPCDLEEGPHELTVSPQALGKIVMIWSPALERGYSPFAPIRPDFTTPQD
ncbi:MAG TPA: hypothetical protein VGM54_18535 [Chthoniobacter sp.]|jgi:hypothetical protein